MIVRPHSIGYALFLAAPLLLAVSHGDLTAQRIGQAIFVSACAGLIVLSASRRKSVSLQTLFLLSALWIPLTIYPSLINPSANFTELSSTYLKLLGFSIVILFFDLHRDRGFVDTIRHFRIPAILIVLLCLSDFAATPEFHFDRLLFFGLQPNLGGEIMVVCALAFSTIKQNWIRYALCLTVLFLLFQLQSRAALVASCIIFAAAEKWPNDAVSVSSRQVLLRAFIFLGAGFVLLLMSIFTGLLSIMMSFVNSEVLMLDDPNRGLGTGLVGRTESFQVFWNIFSKNPWLGIGLDNAAWQGIETVDESLHNGILVILAEYGLIGILILGILLRRLFVDGFNDKFLLSIRIALLFMFFLSARSVNLGVFPMIMWIAFLPWRAIDVRSRSLFCNKHNRHRPRIAAPVSSHPNIR